MPCPMSPRCCPHRTTVRLRPAAIRCSGRAPSCCRRPALRSVARMACSPPTTPADGWEKFCRRNRLAQRPVDLSAAGWWRHDLGPLLGFRSDGGLPVALVADETGYLLTDPATGSPPPPPWQGGGGPWRARP